MYQLVNKVCYRLGYFYVFNKLFSSFLANQIV